MITESFKIDKISGSYTEANLLPDWSSIIEPRHLWNSFFFQKLKFKTQVTYFVIPRYVIHRCGPPLQSTCVLFSTTLLTTKQVYQKNSSGVLYVLCLIPYQIYGGNTSSTSQLWLLFFEDLTTPYGTITDYWSEVLYRDVYSQMQFS